MADCLTSAPAPQSSFITITSANRFSKEATFYCHVIFSLHQVEEYHEFVFTDVRPSWASAIWKHIDEKIPSRKTYNTKSHSLRIRVMPTEIHDCIQGWLEEQKVDWIYNGDITREEAALLFPKVGTTLKFRHGLYKGSKKEPDLFLRVNGHILPTLAVESGWSESRPQLHDDMNLLLVGGNGSIGAVIVIQWTKLQEGSVSGTLELFKRDPNGMPILVQSETIFPRPATTSSQRLRFRRCDIFGPALLAGRNANDILYLDVEQLRKHATRALGFMNFVPA